MTKLKLGYSDLGMLGNQVSAKRVGGKETLMG